MRFLVGDEIDQEQWDYLLNQSLFSSPFQTPSYFCALKETRGFDATVFALSSGRELKALVVVTIMQEPGLMGHFSRRGIIFGGPLLLNATNNEISCFLKETESHLSGKVIYYEIRNFFDYSVYDPVFKNAGLSYVPYLNFQLDLTNLQKDNFQSLFKYNRRREVKQTIANGASYGICDSETEIREIYRILSELYRKRVKLPLPSIEYFLNLKKNNILKCFVVRHNGNVIGGSFCPFLPGKNIYTYYYCGLKNYHRQIFPTHLAVLASIEYAVLNNIPFFDFMGAGQPGISYGVRTYKSEFGGTLVEHGRYVKINNKFLYGLGRLAIYLFKICKYFKK